MIDQTRAFSWCRWGLLMVLIGLLSACSATRFAYGFLDNLIRSEVTDYVPVDRAQRRLLTQGVDDFHHWHRCEELPRYSELLTRLRADLNSPVSVAQLQTYTDEIDLALERAMVQVHPWAAELLSSLSAEQVDELRDNLAAEHKKTANEYAEQSMDEAHEERIEAMTDGLKRWLGRLNPDQQGMVAQWSQDARDMHHHFQDSSEQWQQRLYALLQHNTLQHVGLADEASDLSAALYPMLVHADQYWSESQQQDMDYNRQLTLDMLARLLNTMSDKQRRRMQNKLADYAEDFNYLADHKRCATAVNTAAVDSPSAVLN